MNWQNNKEMKNLPGAFFLVEIETQEQEVAHIK